jgi:hypothetical protein
MRFITSILFTLLATFSVAKSSETCDLLNNGIIPQNNCISFSVGAGTGCQWMCSYCANTLGTNNYYFTTDVCTYQEGGCVGSPQSGVTYTCCSA